MHGPKGILIDLCESDSNGFPLNQLTAAEAPLIGQLADVCWYVRKANKYDTTASRVVLMDILETY